MRIATSLGVLGCVVALSTVALAAPASAAADNPTRTPVPQELLITTMAPQVSPGLPAGVRAPASAAANDCKTFTFGVNATTGDGIWEYTFIQDVGWCYNGSSVTFHSVNYRENTGIGWFFRSVTSQSHQASAGNTLWQDQATALYELCLPAVGCIRSGHPWISTIVRGNGTASGSGSAAA
jgi:hypothetical protein